VNRQTNLSILVLLVIAVGINYIDRGTLAVSKEQLQAEFSLSNLQMGWLFSAFFWSYALFQLVAGWLVDRYDVKWVYAIGFLVWSVATALMGVVAGFAVFFMLRLLLGLGESVAYPATSRILAANYREEQRGLANALIDAGSKIGPALSLLVGGLVVAQFGWRTLFIGVGTVSLLWLVPWILMVPSQPRTTQLRKASSRQPAVPQPAATDPAATDPSPSHPLLGSGSDGNVPPSAETSPTPNAALGGAFRTDAEMAETVVGNPYAPSAAMEQTLATGEHVSWQRLLERPEVWGTSLGMFCLGYAWYFLVSWLPSYLETDRGFSKEQMAVFGSIPFWVMAATSVFGGWASDRWIRGGGSPTRVRKTFVISGFLLCALFMVPAVLVADATSCIVFLSAACASLGLYSSNVWAITQSLAGPAAAGKWTGFQNCIGNFGGVVSPVVTGWLVQRSGSFTSAFAVSSAMLLIGIAAYLFLVPRVAPIAWRLAGADLDRSAV
jgi:MFS family permease